MEKYCPGGVSAIISPNEASNITDHSKENPTSSKIMLEFNVERDPDLLENEYVKYVKPRLPWSRDNVITNESNLSKKKRKKNRPSNVRNNVSLEDIGNMSCMRRKSVADETQAIETGTVNNLSNEVKQSMNVRKNRLLKSREPAECEDHNSNDMKNVQEIFNKSHENKKLIKKEVTSMGFDKSSCTVFVGNLPLSYDHKKVVRVFSKFGEVENARIRCVPVGSENIKKRACAIMKNFHPRRNSAVAYVVFKSEDSVANAVAHNGMILNGHHLRIDNASSQKRDLNKSVFVGGLPFDIQDDELWNLFKDCGDIDSVRVIRDEKVGMGKGFGYVNFKSSASVELALKLNGQEIKNRKINVERCTNKKKKNNPTTAYIYDKKKKRQDNIKESVLARKKLKESSLSFDFQGRKAEKKSKKKKKGLTTDAIRRNQIKSVFVLPLEKKKMKK